MDPWRKRDSGLGGICYIAAVRNPHARIMDGFHAFPVRKEEVPVFSSSGDVMNMKLSDLGFDEWFDPYVGAFHEEGTGIACISAVGC
ncbi:MAG: hypothetical protein AB2L22_08710 [Syntrophales bacterium]